MTDMKQYMHILLALMAVATPIALTGCEDDDNNKDVNDDNVDEVYNGMKKSLLWDLTKEALAKQLDVKVTDEDLKEMAKSMARQQFAQYGMANAPEEAVERFAGDILKDTKNLDQIKARTADMKFFNTLKNAVTLGGEDRERRRFQRALQG